MQSRVGAALAAVASQLQAPERKSIFDYQLYQAYLRSKLQTLLENFQRDMLLVFDSNVQRILNHVAGKKFLQENGVKDLFSLDRLTPETLPNAANAYTQVLFFVSATVQNIKEIDRIARQVLKVGSRSDSTTIDLVLWPKKTQLCMEALNRLDMKVHLHEIRFFSFDLIPIEEDVLSLEMGIFVRQLHLDDDQLLFQQVVESLERIQLLYGRFQNKFFKGEQARSIFEMFTMRNQQSAAESDFEGPTASTTSAGATGAAAASSAQQPPEIETLIIIDRTTDLITPLISQPTFEGALDELFGFDCNLLSIPSELVFVSQQDAQAQPQRQQAIQPMGIISLRGTIENPRLFKKVRTVKIEDYQSFRNARALLLQEFETLMREKKDVTELPRDITQLLVQCNNERKDIKQLDILHEHIQKGRTSMLLRKQASVENKIVTREIELKKLQKFLEALIAAKQPLLKVLRFAALKSAIDGGLEADFLQQLQQDIVQVYGFSKIAALQNLRKAGIIRLKQEEYPWLTILEKFKLLVDEYQLPDTKEPTNIAYFYSGVAPLIPRMVEIALQERTWKKTDGMKYVPGAMAFPQNYIELQAPPEKRPCVLVYIVGGVTLSEISALRFLGARFKKDILIATTNIINWKSYIRVFVSDEDPQDVVIVNRDQQQQQQPEAARAANK